MGARRPEQGGAVGAARHRQRDDPLAVQPIIVPSADAATLRTIYRRAMERGARLSLYVEEMFRTGHDAANRAAVRQYAPDAMNVGLGLRDERRTVDRITRGARMHA
jgi:hypothetical protein